MPSRGAPGGCELPRRAREQGSARRGGRQGQQRGLHQPTRGNAEELAEGPIAECEQRQEGEAGDRVREPPRLAGEPERGRLSEPHDERRAGTRTDERRDDHGDDEIRDHLAHRLDPAGEAAKRDRSQQGAPVVDDFGHQHERHAGAPEPVGKKVSRGRGEQEDPPESRASPPERRRHDRVRRKDDRGPHAGETQPDVGARPQEATNQDEGRRTGEAQRRPALRLTIRVPFPRRISTCAAGR